MQLSRRFFRYQDRPNWLMSYASFVIIWHFMANEAYDIKIWQKLIWPILMPKEVSGHQHPILFKKKILYKFWKSFDYKGEGERNPLSVRQVFQSGLTKRVSLWKGHTAKISISILIFIVLTYLNNMYLNNACLLRNQFKFILQFQA